jgi:hypothetical protein
MKVHCLGLVGAKFCLQLTCVSSYSLHELNTASISFLSLCLSLAPLPSHLVDREMMGKFNQATHRRQSTDTLKTLYSLQESMNFFLVVISRRWMMNWRKGYGRKWWSSNRGTISSFVLRVSGKPPG